MATDIAWRIIRWHPLVLTTVFLFGFTLQVGVAGLTPSPIARGVLSLTPLGPHVHLAMGCVPGRKTSVRRRLGRLDWVFALPPAIALAAGLAGWSTDNSPAAFGIFLSLLGVLSLSAKALEIEDAPNGKPSIGRMLATVLLMYLVPIGLWVLRPKILRLAARAAPLPV